MQRTQNYNLCQWEAEDRILRSDFNADNQKIDAALAAAGNCHIVTGSYVGTGPWGSEHPNTLTFDFEPKALVILGGYTSLAVFIKPYDRAYTRGQTGDGADIVRTTWTVNSVSWYADISNANLASTATQNQMNRDNVPYTYFAIG